VVFAWAFLVKRVLDNVFQPACDGGDVCRLSRLASAVQSAPHWIVKPEPAYSAPDSHSTQKTIEDRSRIGAFFNQNHDENRNTQPHTPNHTKEGYSLLRAASSLR
jgi:hypothetical protein